MGNKWTLRDLVVGLGSDEWKVKVGSWLLSFTLFDVAAGLIVFILVFMLFIVGAGLLERDQTCALIRDGMPLVYVETSANGTVDGCIYEVRQ